MKAARFYHPNEPLRLEEIPTPSIDRDEALVEVKACGICHSDLHIIEGKIQVPRVPLVLGHEISGKLVQIESKMEQFSEGDRVLVSGLTSCGCCRYCSLGQDNICPSKLELAEAPESWQSLSGKLKCPVSILPSPVESPESFNPSEFMVNIGLAFKELHPEKGETNVSLVNFNALPEIYLPKAIALSSILAPVCVIIGAGILVYMGLTLRNTMAQNEILRSELADLENLVTQERVEIATLGEQVAQLESEIAPMEDRAAIFEGTFASLGENRALVDRHMDDIVRLLPQKADFIKIEHEEDVTVNGLVKEEIDSEDVIFAYARDLRERFLRIIISSIEAMEDEEGDFTGYEFEFLLE